MVPPLSQLCIEMSSEKVTQQNDVKVHEKELVNDAQHTPKTYEQRQEALAAALIIDPGTKGYTLRALYVSGRLYDLSASGR